MNRTDWLTATMAAGVAGAGWFWLPPSQRWIGLGAVGVAVLARELGWKRNPTVIELGGMTWDRHAFCQSWLITGATGSGKTCSGILHILHQLFKRRSRFGLLCIDD